MSTHGSMLVEGKTRRQVWTEEEVELLYRPSDSLGCLLGSSRDRIDLQSLPDVGQDDHSCINQFLGVGCLGKMSDLGKDGNDSL